MWAYWALNLLGVLALLAVVLGAIQLYRELNNSNDPRYLETEGIISEFNKQPKRMPKNPGGNTPSPRKAKDVAQKVLAKHINSFLLRNYNCEGMKREEYVRDLAEAILLHSGDINRAFWFCGMAQTESSYRLSAKPGRRTNSSARGYLQVIWRYHGGMLSKNGIRREDLSTDIGKSVLAGVLVFNQYLRREKGDFRLALRRYRSLSASEAEQQAYYKSVSSVFLKLKEDLRKEVKTS